MGDADVAAASSTDVSGAVEDMHVSLGDASHDTIGDLSRKGKKAQTSPAARKGKNAQPSPAASKASPPKRKGKAAPARKGKVSPSAVSSPGATFSGGRSCSSKGGRMAWRTRILGESDAVGEKKKSCTTLPQTPGLELYCIDKEVRWRYVPSKLWIECRGCPTEEDTDPDTRVSMLKTAKLCIAKVNQQRVFDYGGKWGKRSLTHCTPIAAGRWPSSPCPCEHL